MDEALDCCGPERCMATPVTPSTSDYVVTAGQQLPSDPTYHEMAPLSFQDLDSSTSSKQVPNTCLNDNPLSQTTTMSGASRLTDAQLEHLLNLYRGMPMTMFVGALKRDYVGDELKLERMRSGLFELVKSYENCPFKNNDLKKRRNGDLLCDKLCRDIHTLLSVVEGEDINSVEMRDIVSLKKTNRSVSGLNVDETQSPVRNRTQFSEVTLLRDTLSSISADLLSFKQKYAANEASRSEQISTMKATMETIKTDIISTKQTILQSMKETKLCIERVESRNLSDDVKIKK